MENQIFDLRYQDEVTKYLLNRGLMKEPFIIENLSTGNMNYVYRAKELDTGKTYILKYAAEHTRISEQILVSTERIRIEAIVLMELNQYVPQYVPHVYQYDDNNKCIIMEDYTEYGILRDKLNQYEIIPDFADNITNYLVKGIIPMFQLDTSGKLICSEVPQINNPLCETTKTYVFSEPFIKDGNSNNIVELLREFVDTEIYQNNELLYEIENLKRQFIDKNQTLIHGDLHTGSIFVNKSSIVIFDYEFAFWGPIGFDIGNLLAHFIFAWLHAKAQGQNREFMYWVENTIGRIIDGFKMNFLNDVASKFNCSIGYSSEYMTAYVNDIIHDTAAFAGVELIRRIIGIAHVSDMIIIDNLEERAAVEKIGLKLAKIFVLNKNEFNNGTDFVKKINEFY